MDKEMDKKVFNLHAEMCKTLAHPIRLEIISLLRDKEKSVAELLKNIQASKGNLSQHLTVLKNAKIVSTRRDGLSIYYKITRPKMIKACDIVREVLFEQIEENNMLLKKYNIVKKYRR
jgi:ArsR family transcriptional regulator